MTTRSVWSLTREVRFKLCGRLCEVCGKPETADDPFICHHLAGKKFMKAHDLEKFSSLARIRHAHCELECHQNYPMGNPPKDRDALRAILEDIKKLLG